MVRSIRKVGDWHGAALRFNETFPQGQDVAVVLARQVKRLSGWEACEAVRSLAISLGHDRFLQRFARR